MPPDDPRSEKHGAHGPGSPRKSNGVSPASPAPRGGLGTTTAKKRCACTWNRVLHTLSRGAREPRATRRNRVREKMGCADRRPTSCAAAGNRRNCVNGMSGGGSVGWGLGTRAVAHLPELGTDLVTALAALDVNDLTHLRAYQQSHALDGARGTLSCAGHGRRRGSGEAHTLIRRFEFDGFRGSKQFKVRGVLRRSTGDGTAGIHQQQLLTRSQPPTSKLGLGFVSKVRRLGKKAVGPLRYAPKAPSPGGSVF
jgi:hypothetical protein